MRGILLVAALICLSVTAFGQTEQKPAPNQDSQKQPVTSVQLSELPLPKTRGFRPRITLQEAMKLAESFIAKEKINISPYFLSEARMIMYGGEKDAKQPCWFFRWVDEVG